MKEQFYSLVLDEYAAPSFCTFTKGYYGSLEDIKGLVNALDTDEHHREYHLKLINAFYAYERGDHTMSYKAAYADLPLLEPVALLGTETLRMENYAWSHTNVWDCQYHLRCKTVESTHWWIKHINRYLRVAKARFVNLQYHNSIRGWIPMPHRFWGFPKMIQAEDGIIFNRLAVAEKAFSTQTEAEADMAAFLVAKDVDFSEFCNDIFGDG